MKSVFITGATQGIGFEFARLFAEKGFNLILAARNEIRLKEIQKLLLLKRVSVIIYPSDLSIIENAEFIYNDLKNKKIEADFVINNAGFGLNGQYTNINWPEELKMLNLNMITLAYFTKQFARDMKERKFGGILNIASTGAFQPGPYMAGYCATKAFVLSLSEAVSYELRGTGVNVTALCPGVTDSNFHKIADTEMTLLSRLFSHASPEEVAKYGFKLMNRGTPVGIHGFLNKMIVASNRFAPRRMSATLAGKLLFHS